MQTQFHRIYTETAANNIPLVAINDASFGYAGNVDLFSPHRYHYAETNAIRWTLHIKTFDNGRFVFEFQVSQRLLEYKYPNKARDDAVHLIG